MPKVQETTLEINLPALSHNYAFLKSKIAPETKFMAVVKAFGYGSDAVEVALHLQQLGVDYFAVAYTQEGVTLRDAGITKPILVLHPQPFNFGVLIDRCLEPSIYSKRVLEAFLSTAKQKKQENYPIHIKFNTGLNRLGFAPKDIAYLNKVLPNKALKVVSVFSHLAATEDADEKDFTHSQISLYKELALKVSENLPNKPLWHIVNTSGILNYPEAHFNMVRSGIGLYGFGNNTFYSKQLKPIATLKSVISQIHYIKPGDSIGYNRAHIAKTAMKTATIPVGHADGIGRQYGNKVGYVTIHQKQAPIIGNVCMDMMMVDVTHIDCEEGDEVIVFGENPTAETLSEKANTISYELITAISQRVKRVIVR